MAIISNQSLTKGAASANFVLENSIQEAKKTQEEIEGIINEIDHKVAKTMNDIEAKTNASVKNIMVAKDEIVKAQNSFIKTSQAIKKAIPISTIVAGFFGGVVLVLILASFWIVPIAYKSLTTSSQIQEQEEQIRNLKIDLETEKEHASNLNKFVLYLFNNDINRARADYQKWFSKNEK